MAIDLPNVMEKLPIEVEASQISSEEDVPYKKDNAWIRLLTKLRWYSPETSGFEKKLVLKLDLLILVFGCLSFFNKYLNQAAITNAYVSYGPPSVLEAIC